MKGESEKAALKLNIQKMKTMASSAITPWQVDGETMEKVTDFIFWGSKQHFHPKCQYLETCELISEGGTLQYCLYSVLFILNCSKHGRFFQIGC